MDRRPRCAGKQHLGRTAVEIHSAARVSTESLLNAESVGAKIVVRLLLLSVPTQR